MGAVSIEAMKKEKRIYIGQLYESFNPPFFYLGTQSLLDPEAIPEFKRGIQVVKEWLREIAYSLYAFPRPHFLTDMFRISNLALTFDPHDALRYLHNSPYLNPKFAVPPYLRPRGEFMLGELLVSLDGSQEWSISAGFLSVCRLQHSRAWIHFKNEYSQSGDIDKPPWAQFRPTISTVSVLQCLCLLETDIKTERFVSARGWGELVRALRNMPQGSLVDELVQLHDMRWEAVPSRPVHGVRIIPFTANEELFQLLGASSSPFVEPANADSDDIQEQQEPLNNGQTEDLTGHGANLVEFDETEGTRDIDETAEMGDGYDEPSSSAIIATDLPQAQPPSEEEKRAALTIINFYKRSSLRRGRNARARPTSITKMFSACLELSREMSWDKNPSYQFVFLGPLPHLLVCLDVALAATSSQKKTMKKRLLEDHHEHLDGLTNRMNELGKLIKSLTHLQKMLEPASELHRHYDIAKLRGAVKETVELLRALPFPTPDELVRNLDIAVKGILTTRRPRKSLPKPDLVLDDFEGL
ncbi:hypothetical protein C0992_005765 [Termitomyces sp. T32_za158]|nr:hypothetical protein C0992_005765 [Termitomyces sp. T32_za158]